MKDILKDLCTKASELQVIIRYIQNYYQRNFADGVTWQILASKRNFTQFDKDTEKAIRISIIEDYISKPIHNSIITKIGDYFACVEYIAKAYRDNRIELSQDMDLLLNNVLGIVYFEYIDDGGVGIDNELYPTYVFHLTTNGNEIISILQSIVEVAKRETNSNRIQLFDCDDFAAHLVDACSELQSERLFSKKILTDKGVHGIENCRNREIKRMLNTIGKTCGYYVADQTQNGESAQGKDSGQVDLFVKGKDSRALTIVEALNLDIACDKSYLREHIERLFAYDCSGNERNYILVYADVDGFDDFCSQYTKRLDEYCEERFCLGYEPIATDYSNIRRYGTTFSYHGREMEVYHYLVKMMVE